MERPPSPASSLPSSLPTLIPLFFTTQDTGWPGQDCTVLTGENQKDSLETVCRLEKLIITSVCPCNLISPAWIHSLLSHPSPFTPKAPRTSYTGVSLPACPPAPPLQCGRPRLPESSSRQGCCRKDLESTMHGCPSVEWPKF